MFEWLESTALAIWISESLWGYPTMLCLHVVGLAMVAGIFIMLDLRILGAIHGCPLLVFGRMLSIAWSGFAINLISGFALFSSQATKLIHNSFFLTKLAAVLVGVLVGAYVHNTLLAAMRSCDEAASPAKPSQILAVLSLLAWLTAIVSGRLIAYF
jgi:hypothetical protein